MGVGKTFSEAFLKAELDAGERTPKKGKVFLSVDDSDKARLLPVARRLQKEGYGLCATQRHCDANRQQSTRRSPAYCGRH